MQRFSQERYNRISTLFESLLKRSPRSLRSRILNTIVNYLGKRKDENLKLKCIKKRQQPSSRDCRVLLISHELTLTGAPLSLSSIAELLIKNGFYVDIWSFYNRNRNDLSIIEHLDCDVTLVPGRPEDNKTIFERIKAYDLVICNTIITGHYAKFLLKNKIPHLWIIRESFGLFDLMKAHSIDKSILVRDQKNTFVVSEMVRDYIYSSEKINVGVIHNFIKDLTGIKNNKVSDIKHFTICGSIEIRKGIDLAIRVFLKEENNDCILHIVGDKLQSKDSFYNNWREITKSYKNIIWHGKLYGEEKWKLFSNTDVFLIPSREESCSRVALEAAMLAKLMILTENVGAKYLVERYPRLVIKNNSANDLQDSIRYLKNLHPNDIYPICSYIRKRYEETSTESIYEKNIINLICGKINKSEKINLNTRVFNISGDVKNTLVFENDYNSKNISIVVPIYNGKEHVFNLIPSLLKNTPKDVEIILIDDCSTDKEISVLLSKIDDDRVIKVHNEHNLGFVQTVNKGIELSQRAICIILNTDTIVPANWVPRLTKPFANRQDVASVTALSDCASIFSFPLVGNDDENKLFADNCEKVNVSIDDIANKSNKNTYVSTPVSHGFCMAINKQIWNKIGGFNTKLFGRGNGEEVDWSLRAIESGYVNLVATNLFIRHYHSGSFGNEKKILLKNAEMVIKTLYPTFDKIISDFLQSSEFQIALSDIFKNIVVSSECKGNSNSYRNNTCHCTEYGAFNVQYDIFHQ